MHRIPFPPIALGLSLLAHVAAASLLDAGGAGAEKHGPAASVMQARMLSAPALAADVAAAGATLSPTASDAAIPPATATSAPEPIAIAEEKPPAEPDRLPLQAEERTAPVDGPPDGVMAAERYHPLDELTDRPRVLINIPDEKFAVLADVVLQPVRAAVLINEEGAVDQVLIDDVSLSSEARELVDASFRSVRFTPGKVGALAVKSRLDIEFSFEQARPVRR